MLLSDTNIHWLTFKTKGKINCYHFSLLECCQNNLQNADIYLENLTKIMCLNILLIDLFNILFACKHASSAR